MATETEEKDEGEVEVDGIMTQLPSTSGKSRKIQVVHSSEFLISLNELH